MNEHVFTVDVDPGASVRADKYVSDHLGLLNRSQLKTRNAVLKENGRPVKWSRKLKPGEAFVLEWDEPEPLILKPEKVDFNIIYEDEDVLVLEKKQGLVVHPAAGNWTGTLVHGLLYHGIVSEEGFGEGADEKMRPGIVHRLDRDTSGVMITAKNADALEFLSRQFREKTVEKRYMALCKGRPSGSLHGEINTFLTRDEKHRKRFTTHETKGKWAESRYEVLSFNDDYALISLGLKTGRTHQLRVHMKYKNCPIVGDPIYGRRDKRCPDATLMLHSWRLKIPLPSGRSQTFYSPLPQRFLDFMEKYGQDKPQEPKRLY